MTPALPSQKSTEAVMKDDTFIAMFFSVILTSVFWVFVVPPIMNGYWREEAIDRDLGLYCPNTGKWAWKGECKE